MRDPEGRSSFIIHSHSERFYDYFLIQLNFPRTQAGLGGNKRTDGREGMKRVFRDYEEKKIRSGRGKWKSEFPEPSELKNKKVRQGIPCELYSRFFLKYQPWNNDPFPSEKRKKNVIFNFLSEILRRHLNFISTLHDCPLFRLQPFLFMNHLHRNSAHTHTRLPLRMSPS